MAAEILLREILYPTKQDDANVFQLAPMLPSSKSACTGCIQTMAATLRYFISAWVQVLPTEIN